MVFPLLFAVLQSIISMVVERTPLFLSTLFLLFIFTIPLGILFLSAFRLFEHYIFTRFEFFLLSFCVGLTTLLIISFFAMFISFSLPTISFIEIILLLFCFFVWRRKHFPIPRFVPLQYSHKSLFFFLLILTLFSYYSIVPLTTDYAVFRDYPLFTLGIEQYSSLHLPFYFIEIYYPPGVSLITGVLHLVLTNNSPTQIMLILAYFFVFVVTIAFYLFGAIGLRSRFLGILFSCGFLVGSVSRNFVTDGSSIPAQLGTISGLLFLLFLFEFFRIHFFSKESFFITSQTKYFIYLIFAGVIFGSLAITHFDTLLTFIWAFLGMLLFFLFYQRWKYFSRFLLVFLFIGLLSFTVASPYLLRSYIKKTSLDQYWTEERWLEHATGELHPKSISEMTYFVGAVLFILGIGGVIVFLLSFRRFIFEARNNCEQMIHLTFYSACFFWLLFLFLSNSFWFLRLAKPFFFFYAINIILWHGITIPLTFFTGFFLYQLYTCYLSSFSSKAIFTLGVIVLTILIIGDYESINLQKTYTKQGGFLLLPFADRAGYVNNGDIFLFSILSNLPEGMIVSPNTIAGQETPIASGKPTFTYFTHHFYDNYQQNLWMENRSSAAALFFDYPQDTFLQQNNISYIFLPAEVESETDYSTLLLSKYSILARKGGAKILIPKPTISPVYHLEIENIINSVDIHTKTYSYGSALTLSTIELQKNQTIYFSLPQQIPELLHYAPDQKARVIIKHLTFILPLSLSVQIEDQTYFFNETSTKVTFTESIIETTVGALERNYMFITATTDGINFFGLKHYSLEIDWIEVEIAEI